MEFLPILPKNSIFDASDRLISIIQIIAGQNKNSRVCYTQNVDLHYSAHKKFLLGVLYQVKIILIRHAQWGYRFCCCQS